MGQGSGLRVQGSEFRVQSQASGSRAQGSRIRVTVLKVRGRGFRGSGLRFKSEADLVVACDGRLCLGLSVLLLQGYLAHEKETLPRTLQQDYAYGATVVLGGGCYFL